MSLSEPWKIAPPSDQAQPSTFDTLFQGLDQMFRARTGPALPRQLVISLLDGAERVTGGVWGCTMYRWLFVQLLFVPASLRAQGIGARLMRAAEDEARARGCIGSYVTAFSFHAEPFYLRLGYTRFGALDDYPPGHQLLHLSKRLDSETAPPLLPSGPFQTK